MKTRIAIIAIVGLLAAALLSVPAEAGVGGCLRNPSCKGYQAAPTPVVKKSAEPAATTLLDLVRWVMPTDLYAAAKGIQKAKGGSQAEGVGGCFFGCKF